MSIDFCSIASGSSGNCIYLSSGGTSVLIDAGISGRRIAGGLSRINRNPKDISGIFVTHEHSDHISGVGIISRRYGVPVYATERTWLAMENYTGGIEPKNVKIIRRNEHTIIGGLTIEPFPIPHDAADPVGFCVFADGKKVTVATDIGHVTETVKNAISDSDVLLIESNHDENMLKSGRYPYYLKKRILGDMGHLSNNNAARLILSSISRRTKHIFLGHLSEENNTPALAYSSVFSFLRENDIHFGDGLRLHLAERNATSLFVRV